MPTAPKSGSSQKPAPKVTRKPPHSNVSPKKRNPKRPGGKITPSSTGKKQHLNNSGELLHDIASDVSGVLSDSESLDFLHPISSSPIPLTASSSAVPNSDPSSSSHLVVESSCTSMPSDNSSSTTTNQTTNNNNEPPTQNNNLGQSKPPNPKLNSAEIDLNTLESNLTTACQVILTSEDPQRPVIYANPHKLQLAIDAICGPVERVEYLKNQSVIITPSTSGQTKLLLNTKMLPNLQLPVHVTVAWQRQFSYGKLYAEEFRHDSLKDLLEILRPHKVVKIRKLFSDPAKAHVPLFVLTFLGPAPKILTVGYVKFKIDTYTPAPLRCRNCWRLRHPTSRCRSLPTCSYCSATTHTRTNCTATTPACINCKGHHESTSTQCPIYLQEQQVCSLQAELGISFTDARQRFQQSHTISSATPQPLDRQIRQPSPEITSDAQFPSLPAYNSTSPTTTQPTPSYYSQTITRPEQTETQQTTQLTPGQILNPLNEPPENHSPYVPPSQLPLPTLSPIQFPSPLSPLISPQAPSQPPDSPIQPAEPLNPPTTTSQAWTALLPQILPLVIRLLFAQNHTDKIEILTLLGQLLNIDHIIATALASLHLSITQTP